AMEWTALIRPDDRYRRNRWIHQTRTVAPPRNSRTSRPYSRAAGTWRWRLKGKCRPGWVAGDEGARPPAWPGRVLGEPENTCRDWPASMVTATAIMAALSTTTSTQRSLTATALAGAALTVPACALVARRHIVITSRVPSTTSSASPTGTA